MQTVAWHLNYSQYVCKVLTLDLFLVIAYHQDYYHTHCHYDITKKGSHIPRFVLMMLIVFNRYIHQLFVYLVHSFVQIHDVKYDRKQQLPL